MSLAGKAAAGFFWTTLASVGSRVVTIAATFLLTRWLAPEVQGEVNVAFVFVLTVGAATTLGVPQYIATHPKAGRDVMFHASVVLIATGIVGSIACVLLRRPVADLLHAPGMAAYVPGLALAALVDRVGSLPRSVLLRDMRFKVIGARVALGEIVYAATAVAFAQGGAGGHAIVYGNLARAGLGLAYLASRTDVRDYLTPAPLRGATFRALWDYGAAISLSFLFHVGSVNWDNLFIAHRFGEATTGLYNQAYRLAELPALSVGEQINDVLVPSFARLEGADARRRGLLRAIGLMGLVVFPMSAGLGVVAHTLVATLYPPTYQGVAPFLAMLAVLGIHRSIGSLATGYLQVVERTRAFIFIDFVFLVAVLASMALLAPLGPYGAAAGVGVAFTINTVQMARALRPEGILVRDVVVAAARPLAACVPMVGAVIGVRVAVGAAAPPVLRLAIEVALGAAVYVAAAFLVARPIVRDFLELARGVARRRRGAAADAPGGDGAPEGG